MQFYTCLDPRLYCPTLLAQPAIITPCADLRLVGYATSGDAKSLVPRVYGREQSARDERRASEPVRIEASQ